MDFVNTQKIETKTLKVNFILSAVFVLFSLVIVYFAKSLTVLLDVGYSFITLLIYIISLYVIKKINQPANKYYPYGYYRLEPVFVILQAGFILVVSVSVIVISIVNLLTHAIIPNYLFALIGSFIGTITCSIMYFYVRNAARKTGSKILCADAELWKADALLSASVDISLAIALILTFYGLGDLAIYVDPSAAIIMGLVIILKPLKLIKEAGLNLLDASVAPELSKQITTIANITCKNQGLSAKKVVITQSGRFLCVDLYLKLPPTLQTKELHYLKTKLLKQYEAQYKKYVTYVFLSI
ncbi:cation diffusion facilitator family transporter [Facilibium subflavum]|uniref:cation diffusion facilitator family transporter n=1 Tax=Facilibium subflavum TaxID=2219058 RepID=UPI000E64F41C|nr:cation diffusion facilitator family transporter [Facilibium subflavum]